MTIADIRAKSKNILAGVPRDLLILAILVLAALLSFGLGYLAGLDAGRAGGLSVVPSPLVDTSVEERVVASARGTKYYLAWCGGANRILPGNQVWFDSAAAAEAAGYASAANCAGL